MDIRYALRILARNPGLSALIILSLAIGIGANTAIFSVVDTLLLRPLPYPDPERLAVLWLRSPGINIPKDWPSPGQYIDIKTQNSVFEEMSISHGSAANLNGLERPERVEILRTSSSLLHMLGAKPFLGRLLQPDEDTPGKPIVAILSHAAWKGLFGADPAIVGKAITLNGNQHVVVGVMHPDFVLNREVMETVGGTKKTDIFLPLPFGADAVKRRGDENFNITARLKPGVTMRQAQADIDVIASRIRSADRRDRTFTISVVPLLEQVVGDVRRAVLVLLGSVGLVLLIACANVANLLLARAAGRHKEVAIRTALGARPTRLMRQWLTESVVLGILGGAAGLLIAWWSLHVVRTINPGNIPRMEAIGINGGVLAFTLGVSILTGILFGFAPALRVARVDLNSGLKAGGRATQGAGGFAAGRHRLRGLLVVAELGLSLMLLIGAGLLIRSFVRLAAVPPGFNPENVISMRLAAQGSRYRPPEPVQKVLQFYREVQDRVTRLPGVSSFGMVTTLPMTGSVSWGGIRIEGYTPPADQPELQVDQRGASIDYFRAMQIPLLKGRFFNDQDRSDSPPVVLIDEKFAKRFWPNEDPIGKRVGSPNRWSTIVGVVGTVKHYGLDIDGRMVVYRPHTQGGSSSMYVVARASGDAAALGSAIAREVHAVDPDVPVYDVQTMQSRVYDSLARQRFSMTMLGAFAAFAMILAVVGVYGVMSYLVIQSTHDIGVRIALGGQRAGILRMVVGHGMQLTGLGIAVGLVGAAALTRVMQTLLFGVSATDAVTFSGVAVFLAIVAFAATSVPALRATRVDPIVALREE